MKNKEILIALIIAVVILAAAAVAYFLMNGFGPAAPANTAAGQPAAQEPPPEIKAIMNNNVTGTVTAISAKSVTVDTDKGQETYNLTSQSFVLQTVDSRIVNKKISDIEKGMKIYVQYDPSTGDALTITILG